MSQAGPPRSGLTSMGRGFEVVSAVAALTARTPGGVSVGDVAEHLGRERSQVSRTLAALARQSHLTRGPDRRYRLSWQWYAAAQEIVEARLRTIGLTVLDELAHTAGESCFLGTLRGDNTVTIAESIPPGSRMIGSWVGRAYPAYCSDAGQATLWDASDEEVRDVFFGTVFDSAGPRAPRSVDDFLARLNEARSRGYAIVDEEAELGLFSVSAPVRDFRGEVVAALQIVGERAALRGRAPWLGAECAAAAARLSTSLGDPGITSG